MAARLRFFTLCCCSLLLGIVSFAQTPDNKELPKNMKFMSLDNIIVTNKDIPTDKPFLIIYFDPDCDHCQQMAGELAQRIGTYPDLTIWMVSNYPVDSIKNFIFRYGLFPARRLSILCDYTSSMHNWFNFADVPMMLLYSTNGKLIKDYDGLPTASEITKDLAAAK